MSTPANSVRRNPELSEAKRALLAKRLRGLPASRATECFPQRPPGPAALSFAQQRLWFLCRLDPDSPVYNFPTALRLRGRLDIPALARCIDEIVRRHEVLRTSFVLSEGEPVQAAAPELALPMEIRDLSRLPAPEREAAVLREAFEDGQRAFDLGTGPLLRVKLLVLGEGESGDEYVLLFTLHHIVYDGWSAGVLFKEFAALYPAFLEGRPSPLPELRVQYADFAHWQRQWLQGERLERQLAFWRRQLEGAPPRLELPTDHPRPLVQDFRGATYLFSLSRALTGRLEELCRGQDATLFVLLLAAFEVLLHRYTGQTDLCVGVPVANRVRPEFEPLIGFFVNTLVLRGDLSGNPRFTEVLRRVRDVSVNAQDHQDLPFERLVEALQPERNPRWNPLFQVFFVLHSLPVRSLDLPGLGIEKIDVESGVSKFDLVLHATEGERLEAAFEYSTALFEEATIARMAGHLRLLLERIAADPTARLGDLARPTDSERRFWTEWNPPCRPAASEERLHQRFEAQAARTPDAVAVVSGAAVLSYGELDARAGRLARALRARGIGPETRVGLCAGRSVEAIVGIFGILKAGGAYVPVDPAAPPERIAALLADCGASAVLTQEWLEAGDFGPEAQGNAESPGVLPSAPDAAAYLIYTSGSTGQPKGVVVSHRNAVASTAARFDFYPDAPDGFLLVSPLAFDSSVAGIFWTLSRGGRLCIPPEGAHQDPRALAELIHRERLSHLLCLPSLYRLVLDQAAPGQLDSLRAAIVAGETCPPCLAAEHYRRLPKAGLYNEYGPTEATVWGSVYPIPPAPAGAPVPIGRPVPGIQAYVLDAGLNPVPVGVPGELYLGGAGVARGYHGRPAATAERFLPDPYAPEPGARFYRTGDRARLRADGQLEFLGRMDQQVKIRGFRIEPGEIEDRLRKHPWIREAAVIAREDSPGDPRLVAYCVPSGEADPAALPEILREFLKETLPDYMIPMAFVPVAELPLNANGKLDRNALPAPDLAGQFAHRYLAPRNGTEARLAELWAALLGVERVGVHDNFFDLGGHSLAAVQLIVRVQQEFGGELSVASLFEAPTVAELAALLGPGADELESLARELARLPEDQARRLLTTL